MEKGYLVINVYADNLGQPVQGAMVEITGGGVKIRATTNSSGQTDKIELPAPDKSLSLNPMSKVRPYATYDLKVSKTGLDTAVINGVEIFAGTTAVQDAFLRSAELSSPQEELITISEHGLWGNYPPKIVVDPFSQLPGEMPGDILPFPIVPEKILVHDGLPTNSSAPNYYIPFTDYIKNVASSEIYSTWPVETIKANVNAILSFTLNRVYSEWYFSKSYPFTITSSTQFDQKFIYGRNTFQEISRIVDLIFYQYIQFGNKQYPFFAQYNDGIKVNNKGWLSQWGSKDLGDKGYKAVDILKYYYGNDISIKEATAIQGMPNSFPGQPLKLGVCGDAVQKMQAELNVISSSYPAIPKIQPTDGKFGAATEASVKKFQSVFSLPANGVVDFATWYKISAIYVGVSNMLKARYVF